MNQEAGQEVQGGRPPRRRGCLRACLLGCVGMLLAAVAIPTLFITLALLRGVPESSPESRELRRTLPAPAGQDGLPATAAAGRVILDLSMGSFEVVPGPAGEPIHVEADFDAGSFELVETYTPSGELGWTYEVTFRSKIGWLRRLMGGIQTDGNRVRIVMPRGVPISLSSRIGVGESEMELGGLWLTDADLSTGIGEHAVAFSEPGPVPLEVFRLSSSVGETRLERLGNASPRTADLSQSLGEMGFDLSGAWQRDARVRVSCGIGECRVRLPGDDVRIDLTGASLTIGEQTIEPLDRRPPPPPGAPTLTLSVSGTLGEMTIAD